MVKASVFEMSAFSACTKYGSLTLTAGKFGRNPGWAENILPRQRSSGGYSRPACVARRSSPADDERARCGCWPSWWYQWWRFGSCSGLSCGDGGGADGGSSGGQESASVSTSASICRLDGSSGSGRRASGSHYHPRRSCRPRGYCCVSNVAYHWRFLEPFATTAPTAIFEKG